MPEESYTALLFEVRDAVARIILNRPAVYNALDATMAGELAQVVGRCAQDAAIRAVILTGAGKALCSGGDLRSFHAALTDGQDGQGGIGSRVGQTLGPLHEAVLGMTKLHAPVIAAVNGVAAGAGLSIACACDIVVVAESARFTVAYTRAGLTPDGSATYFLPRRIGMGRALDLTLTNRTFSACEALEWGLASRVVPNADLMTEVGALAAQLVNGATGALGAAKTLLYAGWTAPLAEQLDREGESIVRMADSPDGRAGIAAFVEKRTPRFTGRAHQ
jgi:2-(1,2-epoxy-1,2-dihydrophenyl)acetyl-CoA isomerase